MELTSDSMIFFLPTLFNHPFIPFLLGLGLGLVVSFLIGLIFKFKKKKTEEFGGIIKDNSVSDLNSTQVIYRSRASLELLRLFIILREARLRHRPVFNATIKKIAHANEMAIKILSFENSTFFQFIGNWPNNSIKLREVLINMSQFSRSKNIESKEYKTALVKTIEDATIILNRELKD